MYIYTHGKMRDDVAALGRSKQVNQFGASTSTFLSAQERFESSPPAPVCCAFKKRNEPPAVDGFDDALTTEREHFDFPGITLNPLTLNP